MIRWQQCKNSFQIALEIFTWCFFMTIFFQLCYLLSAWIRKMRGIKECAERQELFPVHHSGCILLHNMMLTSTSNTEDGFSHNHRPRSFLVDVLQQQQVGYTVCEAGRSPVCRVTLMYQTLEGYWDDSTLTRTLLGV